jgi:hypothetical protein
MDNRCVTSGSAHSIERLIRLPGPGLEVREGQGCRAVGLSGTGRQSACMPIHKAVGANGGALGKSVSRKSGAAVLGLLWAIWWELSLKLANSYRPARALTVVSS